MRSPSVTRGMSAWICCMAVAVTVTCMSALQAPAYAEPRATSIADTASNVPGITVTPAPDDTRDLLSRTDELAALEAIQRALSSVADGATYVWRPDHGYLNAVIRPTQSFKDRHDRVCRHVMIMLNSGTFSRRAEGIACRLQDGLWSLEG